MSKKLLPVVVSSLLGATATTASADLHFSGFATAAVAWSNVDFVVAGPPERVIALGSPVSLVIRRHGVEPTYLQGIRKTPSFEQDSRIGLQFAKDINDHVKLTGRFIGRGVENFDVDVDRAYLSYSPYDHFEFRAGRLPIHVNFHSAHVPTGYNYVWIRPPQEVYSQLPVKYHNGVDVQFNTNVWHRDLTMSFNWGSTNLDAAKSHPVSSYNISGLQDGLADLVTRRIRNTGVARIRYGDEVFAVRASYHFGKSTYAPVVSSQISVLNNLLNRISVPGIQAPAGAFGLGSEYQNYLTVHNNDESFQAYGYTFDWQNVISQAEYVRRKSNAALIPNLEGWYVMLGYRWCDKFTPHVTYSRQRVTDEQTRKFGLRANEFALGGSSLGADGLSTDEIRTLAGRTLDEAVTAIATASGADQTSVTVGLRWDVFPATAVKAEWQHVHVDKGTHGLFDVDPKKGVNIWTLGADVVFS